MSQHYMSQQIEKINYLVKTNIMWDVLYVAFI